MSSKSVRSIPTRFRVNQNGLLIIQALQDLNRPATAEEITQQLAIRTNARQQHISRIIKKTLVDAVGFGFIQLHNGNYCIMPTKVGKPLTARRSLRKSISCKTRRATSKPSRKTQLKRIRSQRVMNTSSN